MNQGGLNRATLRRRGTPFGDAAAGAGVSFQQYRSKDQGGAFSAGVTRFHIWGLHSTSTTAAAMAAATVDTLDGNATGQQLIAIPQWFDAAGTINRLVTRTNGTIGAAGAPKLKLGIYSNSTLASGNFAGSPYPGTLLVEGDDHGLLGSANLLLENIISQAVTAGTRLWAVWACNAQACTNQHTVPAVRRNCFFPILGYTCNVGGPTTIAQDNFTAGVGWRHAITYTGSENFPDPYPQSAPAILNAGGAVDSIVIPMIGFGFVPS